MGVLVKHCVQISDKVVLQDNLICQEMGEDGKGGSVQLGQSVPEVLVRQLVCMRRAFEVDLVFVQSNVVAVGARLLVLESLAAALVALIVDLQGAASAMAGTRGSVKPTFASSRFLMAFFMGFSESRASLAGMMSFLSMSLTSSIMSVLSSAKASTSAAARSRVAGGVDTATCEPPAPPSPPNGL
jgi:hypothetical protein